MAPTSRPENTWTGHVAQRGAAWGSHPVRGVCGLADGGGCAGPWAQARQARSQRTRCCQGIQRVGGLHAVGCGPLSGAACAVLWPQPAPGPKRRACHNTLKPTTHSMRYTPTTPHQSATHSGLGAQTPASSQHPPRAQHPQRAARRPAPSARGATACTAPTSGSRMEESAMEMPARVT